MKPTRFEIAAAAETAQDEVIKKSKDLFPDNLNDQLRFCRSVMTLMEVSIQTVEKGAR